MKQSLLTAIAVAGLLGAFAPQTFADHHGGKETTVKGKGMCAKCELGETDKCVNAIKTTEDGKEVVYYMTENDVSKGFHKNVCQKTVPVYAVGTVATADGKKQITVTKAGVQEEKILTGTATCAKCGLKKTEKCQNAIKVEKDGKTMVYLLDHNDISKKFHSNVCQGEAKVRAEGTAAKIGDRYEFTASKIEKQ